jgi:hypothetical protein
MPYVPDIGEEGGQRFDVRKAIQNALDQMASGAARVAPAVIKELLQNADDAEATLVSVVLDERLPPEGVPAELRPLCEPALVVRNNQPFQPDDFEAITEVASGHKWQKATAAGRFGIGFNSVYFLTDVPVIFSRREVHIFDLLHRVLEKRNGWRFSLDDFKSAAPSSVGVVKSALEWMLPKAVLAGDRTFGEVALNPAALYEQAVFRLPLRETPEEQPSLFADRFRDASHRARLLAEVIEQAARSVLFLKHVNTITFEILRDEGLEEVGHIDISPAPHNFKSFLDEVKVQTTSVEHGPPLNCRFNRSISWWTNLDAAGRLQVPRAEHSQSFHVRHAARFDNESLLRLRERLQRNKERAVPWVALAVPLDVDSFQLDGTDTPYWRVFLPLDGEQGPCACPLSAALFIDQSRRHVEFRLDGSDEAQRKTEWNKALVKDALVPLLSNATADMPDLLAGVISESPKTYLSLFPLAPAKSVSPSSLSEYLQECFSDEPWLLKIHDVWQREIGLLVGEAAQGVSIELIPDWLRPYTDCFHDLSDEHRRFVAFSLGDALQKRLGEAPGIRIIRRTGLDVLKSVLAHDSPPNAPDLDRLLKRYVDTSSVSTSCLEDLWCFQGLDDDGLLRYSSEGFYVYADAVPTEGILADLRKLSLKFEHSHWVRKTIGIPSIPPSQREALHNVTAASDSAKATLELLRRIDPELGHDSILQARTIRPVVDFLTSLDPLGIPQDLRLAFLVRSAENKSAYKKAGSILIRPIDPSSEDGIVWETMLRRNFAEVHSDFAREINRLLDHAPQVLPLLHDAGCRVVHPTLKESLRLLHDARVNDPGFIDRLRIEFDRRHKRGGQAQVQAESAAALVVSEASRGWEKLTAEEQATVLALPIHRRPDGTHVTLVDPSVAEPPELSSFRLQSEDDLRDAPIELQEYSLLQSDDRDVSRFYRLTLGLEAHGRTAVLKEVLRQIGHKDVDSEQLLAYLAKYYTDTVEQLEASIEPADQADGLELRSLMASSHSTPCIDGLWRPARECQDSATVVKKLSSQGWERKELHQLLGGLFDGQPLLSNNTKLRGLARKFYEFAEAPLESIFHCAVSSESEDLPLKERCKLIVENPKAKSAEEVGRAAILDDTYVPTLGGERKLADAKLVTGSLLGHAALKCFHPTVIDMTVFAGRFDIQETEVGEVLSAFSIPQITGESIKQTVIQQFSPIWPDLDNTARFELLDYIGRYRLAGQLEQSANSLDVVLARDSGVGWTQPAGVVSPKWLRHPTEVLSDRQLPRTNSISEPAREVWDEWCGLKSFSDILSASVKYACTQSPDRRHRAALNILEWLESVKGDEQLPSDLLNGLRSADWVYAKRGTEFSFKCPSDLLVHKGHAVLNEEFWVPAVSLPAFVIQERSSIGFQTAPEASKETIDRIVSCLEGSKSAKPADVLAVYRVLKDLIGSSDKLTQYWFSVSIGRRVLRLFRSSPDSLVTRMQVFLGRSEGGADIGSSVFCLQKSSDVSDSTTALYKSLGVEQDPTGSQALDALIRLEGPCEGHLRTFQTLVKILIGSAATNHFAKEQLQHICVPCCAKSFQRLEEAYWDEDWGAPGRPNTASAHRLIDGTNRPNRDLINFLDSRSPGIVRHLRWTARADFYDDPSRLEVAGSGALLVGPWLDWFRELCRADSTVNAKAVHMGLSIPRSPMKLEVVERIPVGYVLSNNEEIRPTQSWTGPDVDVDGETTVFLSRGAAEKDYLDDSQALQDLDRRIAARVAELLIPDKRTLQNRLPSVSDFITQELERPSAVLNRLHEANRDHFFHQYYDQVADQEFARLFDQYRKTKRDSQRWADLRSQMDEIITSQFVQARRDQIRGHGYSEKSVFAELVQNAEDAYVQRSVLGMDEIEPAFVQFRYSDASPRSLIVEHSGRPFNYSRHGTREESRFNLDVEGVLRSAGSYKPTHGGKDRGRQTIGRFGLGFKSVFLLCDTPVIHSGQWHFQIESGCLPRPVQPPADLNQWDTRMVLPLLPDVNVLRDLDAKHLAGLLPFLRCVTSIGLMLPDATRTISVELQVDSSQAKAPSGHIAELVCIDGASHVPHGQVVLLRMRHTNHHGQLGILLAEDMTPSTWDDAFESDLYVALPLQSRLGCGIGVSSILEVQSGRTHLVDPETNVKRFREVAALLRSLPAAVSELLPGEDQAQWYLRFWNMWRWDEGDAESGPLRECLAKELVTLAWSGDVVPTESGSKPRRLGEEPLFYFTRIPSRIRGLSIDCSIPISTSGRTATLTENNVVPEGFATAFTRACRAANHVKEKADLHAVTWPVLGQGVVKMNLFSDRPEVMSEFAEILPEAHREDVREWLPNCQIRGVSGDGSTSSVSISDVLSYKAQGLELLPRRLLSVLDSSYNEAARELLEEVGLSDKPSPTQIQSWLSRHSLNSEEGIELLRYFLKDERFTDYWGTKSYLRQPCFRSMDGVVTAVKAVQDAGVTEEFLASPEFAAWIGLEGDVEPQPEPEGAVAIDPGEALQRLSDWWKDRGQTWTEQFERRTYPEGSPPRLTSDYLDTTSERREWLTLLLIASLGSLGRVKPEQNRDFLNLCEKRGWMKTFVGPRSTAQEWINVLDGYLDEDSLTLEYYQWMQQFVRIFHLSRWLKTYVNQFLSINLRTQISPRSLLSPSGDSALSGTGVTAPPLPLGVGTCFVIRELTRLGALGNQNAYQYCYVPFSRVRRVMQAMGCEIDGGADLDNSIAIHQFLQEHLGDEEATFGGSFDLPILALAEDAELQRELLGKPIDT